MPSGAGVMPAQGGVQSERMNPLTRATLRNPRHAIVTDARCAPCRDVLRRSPPHAQARGYLRGAPCPSLSA